MDSDLLAHGLCGPVSILQREIGEPIRRNHPNPNRINCVGTEKLSKIARGELTPEDPACSHIMECSPCYEEVMTATEQVQSERSRAVRKRTPLVIAAVAAIVIAGIAVLGCSVGLVSPQLNVHLGRR
jgi:hypothetical protein